MAAITLYDQANTAELRRVSPTTNLLKQDYLVMRPLIEWMRTVAPNYVSGKLVDFGCGNKPYQEFFAQRITSYVGVDIAQNVFGTVDVLHTPGAPLPFADNSFDCALSTQVLEHTSDPGYYLKEISRVLVDNGALVLTCPGEYMLHEEPHDYYRYTKYGLKHLLEQNNFAIVRIDECGGAWRLLGQTFLNHKAFGRKFTIPVLTGLIFYFWVLSSNILFSLLDSFNTNRKETVNYMVIARKNAS